MMEDEGVREEISLAKVIMFQLRDIDKMIASPYPNDKQFCRSVELLKAKLFPYADDEFKTDEKTLQESRLVEMKRTRKNQHANINMDYYNKLYSLIQFLIKRRRLGFEEQSTMVLE